MVRRIKILYTIPNFDTAGSGKVVYDLVKHIDKGRFEPHICCMHNRGDYFKTIESLGVPIHIFQFATHYRPFFSFPYRVLKIAQFLKKQKFDLIHSWHWSSDISEPLAAKLAAIPFIYTKKAMGWGNKSWTWRSQLSKRIVTINSDMKQQFFNGMPQKVAQIPIGIDATCFSDINKSNKGIKELNVKDEDFVIVSIANLVPVKGIELLLEAVKQLNDKTIKVLIVGNDTSEYAKELKRKYTSKFVCFTGKKENIVPYLAMADVFVIPTKNEGRKEGQPIAPIEAMLAGVIVLGSEISGIKDILSQFKSSLFKPGNIEGLKCKIQEVLKMKENERNILSQQMREVALRDYNINLSITRHQELYESLISG